MKLDSRARGRFGVLAVLLLTAWAALFRSSGLNPPTLWNDDVWVAALTRVGSIVDALLVPAPVPPAFLGTLWIAHRFVPDPELGLQLVPFICALITPGCVALLVFRLSQSHALAVTAACLVVLNPNSSHFSVFVKQYVSDELTTALLLLLGAWALENRATERLRVAAVAAIGAMFLSFTSVFSGAALLAVATLSALRGRFLDGISPWPVLRVVGWLTVGAVLVYVGVLSGRSNQTLSAFWEGRFVPVEDAGATWEFLRTNGAGALRGALPELLAPGYGLAAVGLLFLLWDRKSRRLGLYAVVFYASIVMASALHFYPISGGLPGRPAMARTDIFSYPVTVSLFVLGLHAVVRWLPKPGLFNVLLCCAALGYAVAAPPSVEYYLLNHSRFPRFLEAVASDSDTILLNPNASWYAGYYSTWPVRGGPRNSDSLLRWDPDPGEGVWHATEETELSG